MKNFYKNIQKSIFIGLAIFALLFPGNLKAQTENKVNITVNIVPPYSPYYSDYSGQNANKVLLIIQNLSNAQKTIKLTGQLTGDNGIKITTKSNYVPLQPIVLNPNEVKQLNGLALKDIFDINALNVYGIDKSRIIYTSRLPEGNYDFCVQAVDMNTNKVLSSQAPLGCTSISIAYPDAPVLVNPIANDLIKNLQPQSVVFNWINPGFTPPNIQYILQVAEMPSVTADPNQVLNATSFPIVNKTIIGTTAVLSPANPTLLKGKKYAWRVKAVDPTGRIVFKNDGVSQANIFYYGMAEDLLAPIINSPVTNTVFNATVDGLHQIASQPKIDIDWGGANLVNDANIDYKLSIIEVKNGVSAEDAFNTNANLLDTFHTSATHLALVQKTNTIKSMPSKKLGPVGQMPVDLATNSTYAIQVTASGYNAMGQHLNFNNIGRSNIVYFTYKGNGLDKNLQPVANNSTISGRLFYKFKTQNEQANNSTFIIPEKFKKVALNQNFNVMEVNSAPYPDYIANNRYKKDENTKALRNTNLTFQYTILQTTTPSPKKIEDFKIANTGNAFSQGVKIGDNYYKSADIYTIKTNEDGSFSQTFLNDYKLGYLGSIGADNYYATIRIAVKTPQNYFCSPDIMLFPQAGKNITIPDEVVFVNAYDLNIPVQATLKVQDQALTAGAAIAGYPIQVIDIHKYMNGHDNGANYLNEHIDIDDDETNMPIEGNSDSYKDQSFMDGQTALPIVDLQNTNSQGVASFKNLLASHSHFVVALEKKYEGNFAYKQSELAQVNIFGKDLNGQDYEIGGDFAGENSICFNNNFKQVTISQPAVIVAPKKPEIYLRAIAIQNGINAPIANAIVKIEEFKTANDSIPYNATTNFTDANGYLTLRDLDITTETQAGKTKVTGPYRRITIRKAGFKDKVLPKQLLPKKLLMFGQRFPDQVEQELQADGRVVGYVVNEKGEPIISNVRVGDGPFIKTADNGWFAIYNCQATYSKIEIVPLVDNYFPESFYQLIKPEDYTIVSNMKDLGGKNVVIEKLHRMQFTVLDANNKPIANSQTYIAGNNAIHRNYTSGADGKTGIATTASAGNEFKIVTSMAGYATNETYVNVPISKYPQQITVKLAVGRTLSGTVIDSKTSQAIVGARVYSISGVNDEGEIQNEVYTDKNGKYVLNGIKDNGVAFNVYAVKSGEVAYVQQVKSATKLSKALNFELTPLGFKAEIWGLPIEITKASQIQNKSFISGSFISLPNNSTFKLADVKTKLPFNDIEITISKPATLNLGGIKQVKTPVSTIAPINNSIAISKSALNVTAFDLYDCEVLGTNEPHQIKNLNISNNNGNGELKGYITSELSSFNFSYNYNGKFLLNSNGIKIPGSPSPPSLLSVFKANTTVGSPSFKLTPLYGISNFKIHDFDALFSTGKFDNTGFQLQSYVKLNIPLVSNNSLYAGQIKINTKDIVLEQASSAIDLNLEKWHLTGTGLQYDVNQGGFKLLNGNLKTNLPQLPLKNIYIRPSQVDLGIGSLTGNEQMSLAGVTPLKLVQGAKFNLIYDEAAPFDQKPHYSINISAPQGNSYVASITGLAPVLAPDDAIKFKMLSTYSDAMHKSILLEETNHKIYNIIDQTVSGIEVKDDYFTLIGNTNLGIPGANSNVTGRLKFSKPAGAIICNVEKLQTDIEMPGKVKFNGNKFTLSKDLFTANGDLIIYKNTPSDGVFVKSTITKNLFGTTNLIDKSQKLALKGTGRIEIQDGGGNKVETKSGTPAWNPLAFTGKPQGFISNGKELLTPGYDLIDFEVNGAISNKPGKTLKLGGFDSPFGNFDMEFDFENKAMMGSLTLKDAHIPIGPVILNSGTIDLQIDGNGFLIAGAITDASLANIPILDNFKTGIALGYYASSFPSYMKNKLLNVTLYKDLPQLSKPSFAGIYVNVMKSISKEQLLAEMGLAKGPSLKDIPIIGDFVPTIDFSAGIDLGTMLNFSNQSILIDGKAFVAASIIEDLKACKIGFSTVREGSFDLHFESPKNLYGAITFAIGSKLYYCAGDAEVNVNVYFQKNPQGGFKFGLNKTN